MTEAKKRGRPSNEQTMESISVRVDLSTIHSIDLIAKYMTQTIGYKITRAQVIRKILIDNINTYVEEVKILKPELTGELMVRLERKP